MNILRYKFLYTIFTGVPYPAKFELPTTWSDTSYTLSWGVNCSINAPIINYQLSFKELPHGPWRSINIPGDFHEKKFQCLFKKFLNTIIYYSSNEGNKK